MELAYRHFHPHTPPLAETSHKVKAKIKEWVLFSPFASGTAKSEAKDVGAGKSEKLNTLIRSPTLKIMCLKKITLSTM